MPHFVLAGPNGSRKTSVLEVVLLALGRDDLLVRNLPKDEREGHWRTTVPVGASLRVIATHVDTPWDAACSWERALLAPESDPRSRARRQAAADNGARVGPMANGDLDALYENRKVSLWVEDSLTRQYLKSV